MIITLIIIIIIIMIIIIIIITIIIISISIIIIAKLMFHRMCTGISISVKRHDSINHQSIDP